MGKIGSEMGFESSISCNSSEVRVNSEQEAKNGASFDPKTFGSGLTCPMRTYLVSDIRSHFSPISIHLL